MISQTADRTRERPSIIREKFEIYRLTNVAVTLNKLLHSLIKAQYRLDFKSDYKLYILFTLCNTWFDKQTDIYARILPILAQWFQIPNI